MSVGTHQHTPSTRAIKDYAFSGCSGLTTAILNDRLEEIEKWAFSECALVRIDIPPSGRAIREGAFCDCLDLTTVILNDGLEVIGERAFKGCMLVCIYIPLSVRRTKYCAYYGSALVRINTPHAVRAIKEGAFCDCSRLTTVILNDGLEVIG